MEQSSDDQSPVKFAYPFIQPPEVFHAPRLGIIHFLAWIAATAVLFSLMKVSGWFDSINYDDSASQNFAFIFLDSTICINMIFIAVGLVGSAVIFYVKIRGDKGRLQAGHWILLISTALSVSTIPLWVVVPHILENMTDSGPPMLWVIQLCTIAIFILGVVLWLFATIRVNENLRWKTLFILFAFSNLIGSVQWFTPGMQFNNLCEKLFDMAIGGVALPIILLIDFRHRIKRDWLHWLGIVIVFSQVSMPILSLCGLAVYHLID